jgi:PAS domain S-box-containing protein
MRAMVSPGRESEPLDVQMLVDSIPSLIHTARPDGYLDYFNKRWLEYLGVTLDKVAGWNWTAFIHPEDVDGIVSLWRACLTSGEVFEYETRVLSANGDYRWMFHRKVPLRDANGDIVRWYGSSMDIEERKTAEESLRSSEAYLAEAQRLSQTGSWANGAKGEPRYWSEQCYHVLGFDPAEPLPSLETIFQRIHADDRAAMREKLDRSIRDKADFEVDMRIIHPVTGIRYIRSTGHPVVDIRSDLREMVGTVIDITEHKRAEEALRRSEAYLAEAQRLSHTGSFGWKVSSGEIFWSDETFRIFECDPSSKPTIEFILSRVHREDHDMAQQQIDQALRNLEGFDFGHRLQLPDGSVRHVRVTARPSTSNTGDVEFVGAVTDITERKAGEEKVRRLIEAGILGIFVATVDGDIIDANEAFLQLLQYGRKDLVTGQLRWADLTPPEWRKRDERSLAEFLATGVFQAYEKEYFRRDGSRVPVLVGGARFQDANEGVVFVLDLSEQKRAEGKIREQEAELRQIVDLTSQLIAVYGPKGERLYANRTMLDYLGVGLDEWRDRSFGASVHPDDPERLKAYTDRALSTGAAGELELRLRKGDGSYRWFLARFNPLRDEQGQITRWYYTGTDIEDRKQAENRLRQENVALREEIDKASMFEEIVGTSPELRSVLSRISKVAPSDSTVLITGETGTGKELVARAIHRRSARASRPFVSVNCAAIPRDLIASELFGHEKGAFTGATQQRLGRFELANGGTLFLDEVGELPTETQIALLRVLQEQEFERVGGSRRIRVDVRVIAATNRDLQAAISTGAFRSDLFYRLNVFPIDMPSLQKRKTDIPLLVEYFIDRYARKVGKNIRRVNKKTLELLLSYPWPGNIRELQNVIERSVILCDSEIFSIDQNWLPQRPAPTPESRGIELPHRLLAQEKSIIEAALKDARGRISGPTGAAVKLGIPRSTLESKIRSLKINKNLFKA